MPARFANATVWLPGLARGTDVLDGIEFDDCVLEGPAVLVPVNSTFELGAFDAPDPSALLWTIESGQTGAVGALIAKDCAFRRCRFSLVGIAADPVTVARFRRDFFGEEGG